MLLNDCHFGSCCFHISRMPITQEILRVSYFLPSIFKYFIEAIKKWPPCQVFHNKTFFPPTPLHMVLSIGPF